MQVNHLVEQPKAGDLFRMTRGCDPEWAPGANRLNAKQRMEFVFCLDHEDIVLVIKPDDWGGYTKSLVRGQIVWIGFKHFLERLK